MKNSNTSYNSLSAKDKEKLIKRLYVEEKKSFADIAGIYSTYANKIRRDAVTFKIPIRDKASAQKNALETGKHKHPTKGTNRSETEKAKIGLGVLKAWDNLSDSELQNRKNNSKKLWEKLDEDSKKQIIKSANQAVRTSSKLGSKLEKFLLNKLLQDGFKVDFHKEQTLSNTKLQLDLFLPTMNTVIEVDGPSHFLPVWGEDALAKNISYDQKKEGLILGKGLVLIRIKQTKDFSKTRSELIYKNLKTVIDNIQNKFPSADNRTFSIEDTNG
jgi:very-short-patch-repair endonuclease